MGEGGLPPMRSARVPVGDGDERRSASDRGLTWSPKGGTGLVVREGSSKGVMMGVDMVVRRMIVGGEGEDGERGFI